MLRGCALGRSIVTTYDLDGDDDACDDVCVCNNAGSCYAVALSGDRSTGSLAPVGGFVMIAGWLTLVALG